jgi:hypothetical protein
MNKNNGSHNVSVVMVWVESGPGAYTRYTAKESIARLDVAKARLLGFKAGFDRNFRGKRMSTVAEIDAFTALIEAKAAAL